MKHPEHSAAIVDDPRLRPLTLHERFSLMRQNVGRPSILVHVVSYPIAALPGYDVLCSRVLELQDRLPMLHAGVVFGRTNRPVLAEGYTFGAFQLVRDVQAARDADPAELSAEESERVAGMCVADNDNRAWSVARITAGERGYVVLALSHLVADGRRSVGILRALLGGPMPDKEGWGDARMLDETETPPSPSTLSVLYSLVRSKLPALPTARTPADAWPGAAPSPLDKPGHTLLLSLDAALISALHSAAKQHTVDTLPPLLMLAYLAALWRVFTPDRPQRFASSSARERRPECGLARTTHNYTAATRWDVTLSASDRVWARARECAARMNNPQADGRRGMGMGMLSRLPDPPVDPEAADYDPAVPTGWERFFVERARSSVPFTTSLHMSDLGRVDLPPGASDAFFAQSACPFGAAYHANIVGHAGGVRVTTTWIEGASGTRGQSEEVHRVFKAVLERMARGEGGRVGEMTEG